MMFNNVFVVQEHLGHWSVILWQNEREVKHIHSQFCHCLLHKERLMINWRESTYGHSTGLFVDEIFCIIKPISHHRPMKRSSVLVVFLVNFDLRSFHKYLDDTRNRIAVVWIELFNTKCNFKGTTALRPEISSFSILIFSLVHTHSSVRSQIQLKREFFIII